MPTAFKPARMSHSTVARMLADASKAESGSHSIQHELLDMAASDSVQEQLSLFDNLALDAETKVYLYHLFCGRLDILLSHPVDI